VTKVVLQQRHKIKGSVTKVTESLVFLELPIQPLSLSKLTVNYDVGFKEYEYIKK